MKETTCLDVQSDQLKEQCPGCGSFLIDSLQNRSISSSSLEQKPATNTIHKPVEGLSSDFQTAYRQVESNAIRISFDIEKLNSLVSLSSHGGLCIIGEQMYTQLMIDRLCVHSMLPRRHGGIGEGYSKIIAIDAGNCSDVHQIVNFARQYGLEIRTRDKESITKYNSKQSLTIYQLAHLIIYQLPRIIEQLSYDKENNAIAIYGLLHLFVSDPHIDRADAKQLIKEIAALLGKISEDVFVVVSVTHINYEYRKLLVPVFDNLTKITNDIENSNVLLFNVHNQNYSMDGKSLARLYQ